MRAPPAAGPGLVERDEPLRELRLRLEAAHERGHLVLVSGEAGAGKTSLLGALADAWRAAAGPVWWGACDALETPLPLAPLLDVARDARPGFASRLKGPRPELFEAVLDELRVADPPVLVVIEDAHWADQATLDLLKYLGRRIERAHALLAVSYRDDEVTPTHPLRRVLGELPPTARSYLPVAALTPAAVELLARRAGRDGAGLHAATNGNAFFVTEVLRDDSLSAAGVPRSVRDVVLARCARLPATAQSVLRLAAVVPGRIERRLVDRLLAPALADLEAALASGLLAAQGDSLCYRHELARVAVETSLPIPVAQDLHGRLLRTLEAEGGEGSAARRVHHALGGADWTAVGRHAPQAAREAAARGAIREAAAHWRRALEHGHPADADERARWLEAFAQDCVAIGLVDDARSAREELERLARARGDVTAAALQVARQAQLHIGSMRHDEANRLNHLAIAMLEPVPPGPVHVTVWRWEADLRMLSRDCAASVDWARRAIDLAEHLGDPLAASEARGSLGTALLFLDYPRGVAEMLAARDVQAAAGHTMPAARFTLNLGSGSGEVMQLPDAERSLLEAHALAVQHEFDTFRDYVRSWLALTSLLRGRWNEVDTWADRVVDREGVAPMSQLMARVALGRLRVRRGDPGACEVLDAGLALTGEDNTLQRIAPLRAARAEAAFERGDADAVRREVSGALALAQAKRHPWFVGELTYWLWRIGDAREVPGDCAEPYALEIAGAWREAAAAWQALDCPFEHARALSLGDSAARRAALSIFDALGARPSADALRRQLRGAGERRVARGVRESTRANPCGLTTAEMKTLAFLAQGLRNAQIAATLHRSVRTVDHHVAAVLAKLGVESRQAAVLRAEREDWFSRGDA